MHSLEDLLSLLLCVCVCVSPRQSRGYDTSPITRRKSYDRAYRYMHCNTQIHFSDLIDSIFWLCDVFNVSCSSLSLNFHLITGPLTAILPLPRLLWGPGTTATSSQGSPATKPKVQLWTSAYIPAQTHTFIHKLPLFFCHHVLIWSIQSHFDRMNHSFSFLSSPPWFEIFTDPVDRLKVEPFEWNVLLSAVMSSRVSYSSCLSLDETLF